MNKRQRRKQIKRLAYLLRTVDISDQLRPSLISTPLSDWATRLGWCERFQTRDGYPWQRLTPKGQAARRELLRESAEPQGESKWLKHQH